MSHSPDRIALPVWLKEPGAWTVTRLYFGILVLLSAFGLPALYQRGQFSGHTLGTFSLLWVLLLCFGCLLGGAGLVGFVTLWFSRRPAWLELAGGLPGRLIRAGRWNGAAVAAVWVVYVVVVFWRYQRHFVDLAPRIWLFWWAVGLGACFLWAAWKSRPAGLAMLLTAVLYGGGVYLLGYLPAVTAFPFSLDWSEGSRYYYAALPYAQAILGERIPLSFLHPSRYLLQSMAFWFPGAGLEFHRFWQVFLWVSLSWLTGLALARRLKLCSAWAVLAVTVWAGLFLEQGPVYYHLLVCVVVVLWGFQYAPHRRRFWRTLGAIAFASAWAGISRVNWFPVPAMLAAALYLLDNPLADGSRAVGWPSSWRSLRTHPWLRYFWPPLAWGVVGVAAAFAAQSVYIVLSGQPDASIFRSSFSSPLLWYRLFPSATYPLGVIPALTVVSAPLLLLLARVWRRQRGEWHVLRVLGLAGLLLVLLLGGLVVSAKIGGGSNLHNMDAFLVLLLVIGASVGFGCYTPEPTRPRAKRKPSAPPASLAGLLAAVVLLPVFWNLNIGAPFAPRDATQAAFDLQKLNTLVKGYAAQGEVLFITQRQLQVFHLVDGGKVVPDYELMTLMEMSMADNAAYFAPFYRDLHNHRFAAIVSDRQREWLHDPENALFAEENNTWVEHVSKPILKDYQEVLFLDTQGIQVLAPRP